MLIIGSGYIFAFQFLSIAYFIAGVFWLGAIFSVKADESELRRKIKERVDSL